MKKYAYNEFEMSWNTISWPLLVVAHMLQWSQQYADVEKAESWLQLHWRTQWIEQATNMISTTQLQLQGNCQPFLRLPWICAFSALWWRCRLDANCLEMRCRNCQSWESACESWKWERRIQSKPWNQPILSIWCEARNTIALQPAALEQAWYSSSHSLFAVQFCLPKESNTQ